jgi:hypothetical protein
MQYTVIKTISICLSPYNLFSRFIYSLEFFHIEVCFKIKVNAFLTNVESEVLTAVVMMSSIFWDIMPCFHASFLLGLFYDYEDGAPPKYWLIFNGLHSITS